MVVTFEEAYLQELYEKGTTNDKKHRYQPDIVRRYHKCVQLMKMEEPIVTVCNIIELSNHYK